MGRRKKNSREKVTPGSHPLGWGQENIEFSEEFQPNSQTSIQKKPNNV
ncbi:hypothetical protein [Heyndrickxia oleronia]|uniref:Uncharacterized protein n=1 Tax=Heyndrickxia oleronia TaxID=38875 RepID=A0AAW6ST81_9BACI|nr:hypothetical protein [Heyndrickxia oleronia]MDH5159784.1 hypothetical protein [Heyndrickxia oleronia]